LAPIAIERLPEYWHPTTQRFATPSTFATADMTEEVTLLTTISEVSRPPLARSRVATSAIFVSFGLVLGTWAAHLPAVKDTIGASSSSMGTILLILGTGAFVGMQISGYVVDRFGSGRVAVIGAAAMAFALVPPLVLSTWLSVALGALTLGLAIGVSEVGMNAAAVEVEREYRRPIMASFHGMFSIGSVIGALLGATAFALGIGALATAMATVLLALTLCGVAAPTLIGRPNSYAAISVHSEAETHRTPIRGQSWRLVVFGALAFLLLLTEGSAMDWSSLHAQQHLGGSASSGALALACFVSAMTVGRFSVDRVAARIGPVRVVRWGSLLCIAALTVITLSTLLPITCSGWILLGLGLSGCVPQVFTATGTIAGASAKALSRVVGAGYLAVLAGPAIVGWLADMFTLNGAFVLPIVAMVICACSANTLAGPGRASSESSWVQSKGSPQQ
jgi:predicted MFS family arabinose efflux permease